MQTCVAESLGCNMIVTPVSHLSSDDRFMDTVLKFGSLEGRDNSVLPKHTKHVVLYHLNLEIHQHWSEKSKQSLIDKLRKYSNLRAISFHMVTCYTKFNVKNGIVHCVGEKMDPEIMLNNTRLNCDWLKKSFPNLKLMVENNNDLGSEAYNFVTDPEFISKVVNDNNIYFLYDHAHAMISAWNQKINFDRYIKKLPINKVLQIHFSEPNFLNGFPVDAHDLPSTEQLEFCKSKFNDTVKYLTVEFYKSLDQLEFSLNSLKNIWR